MMISTRTERKVDEKAIRRTVDVFLVPLVLVAAEAFLPPADLAGVSEWSSSVATGVFRFLLLVDPLSLRVVK